MTEWAQLNQENQLSTNADGRESLTQPIKFKRIVTSKPIGANWNIEWTNKVYLRTRNNSAPHFLYAPIGLMMS